MQIIVPQPNNLELPCARPLIKPLNIIMYYYSFKIFPRFCLVKATRIIHDKPAAVDLACEQALHLGVTRDLLWARAANGRKRIGAGAS